MKITKIKWPDDHKVLKGLELDLTDANGDPYNTILLAADNGLGKTTILRSISDFFEGIDCVFDSFEYTLDGHHYVARRGADELFKVSKDEGNETNCELTHWKDMDTSGIRMQTFGGLEEEVPQAKSAKFSPAITTFIDNSTSVASSDSEIKNTLITLERQDNEEYRSMVTDFEKNGTPIMPPSKYDNNLSRITRFKNAFNLVFDHVEFKGVNSKIDRTEVLFSKNGSPSYDIDNLSTGEKQIVYRGTYLLEGTERADVALVDEPELSMHPRWQSKILDFYKHLFVNSATGTQETQLFVATHSDHVIAKAIADTNTLVLRLSDNGANLIASRTADMVLPTTTAAEINYLAFGIYSVDYHIHLFGQLQQNIEAHTGTAPNIKDTDNSIKQQPLYLGNLAQYAKQYAFDDHGRTRTYDSLSAYIRNCIDHPGAFNPNTGANNEYNDSEMELSTEFLRSLLITQRDGTYVFR